MIVVEIKLLNHHTHISRVYMLPQRAACCGGDDHVTPLLLKRPDVGAEVDVGRVDGMFSVMPAKGVRYS